MAVDCGVPMKGLAVAGSMLFMLAGSTSLGNAAISVPATSTTIGIPGAVTVAPSGDIYFSSDPGIIFKVDTAGQLTRIAGSWTNGYSGDGGPAVDAQLSFPVTYPELQQDPFDFGPLVGGLAFDGAGSLYVADNYNNRVRKITADGVINTIAGTDNPTSQLTGTDGLLGPGGVVVSSLGQVYVSYWGGVGLVTPQGTLTPLVPYNCGTHSSPGLCGPGQMAAGPNGLYYVTDGYCDVRAFGADGVTHEVAGNPNGTRSTADWTCGYGGDGGPAEGATLLDPTAVAIDRSGVLYIADAGNHCIRRVDTLGIIGTFAGHCGDKNYGYAGDGGPAVQALLNTPWGVAVDEAGNVFIADAMNHRIRKVTPDGVINTVAGDGTAAPVVYSFKPLAPASTTTSTNSTPVAPSQKIADGGGGAFDLMTLLMLGAWLLVRCGVLGRPADA
jgi:sugar lactone lactonase YvrE